MSQLEEFKGIIKDLGQRTDVPGIGSRPTAL